MTKHISLRLVAFVAAFTLLAGAARTIGAQEATPAAQPIVDELLGHGLPADAPGKVLQLERVTIAPGAAIPTHIHPGAYVIYVESGDFGFTLTKGEAEITHAGATSGEPIAAGTEVIAHAGDALFEIGGVVHSARNAGDTPVVVLTAALLAAGQPSLQPTNAEGTPMPMA
jgi:quercetin dioxygenase-like cupin family protein